MVSYQVDILNPKAGQLLKDLADMDLIAIKENNRESLIKLMRQIRKRAEILGPPTLEEITEEVEIVRAERYARTKNKK